MYFLALFLVGQVCAQLHRCEFLLCISGCVAECFICHDDISVNSAVREQHFDDGFGISSWLAVTYAAESVINGDGESDSDFHRL